jgi:nucleotide-binding universal stress UspA family protein
MKKILIALDYFPTAQQVAEQGYAIAKAMHAETILIHVMANPNYYISSIYDPIMGYGGFMHLDFFQSDILALVKNESNLFLQKTKEHLGSENISTIVDEGKIADTILEVAKAKHADMIVMGSHSKSWLEQKLIGSEAETVLHKSTIPILIIPTSKHA